MAGRAKSDPKQARQAGSGRTTATKASRSAKAARTATKATPATSKTRTTTQTKGQATKTAKATRSTVKQATAIKAATAKPKPVKRPPAVAGRTLEKLKARLEEERATYVRQAEELAAEAEALMADREPGDTQFDEESGEGDTINVERERDLALSASARQSVEEIDGALARMKAGTYGYCERCGNKIPVARLEAVPQAALCIECKSRQERRR